MKTKKYLVDLLEDVYLFFKERYPGNIVNFTDKSYNEVYKFTLPFYPKPVTEKQETVGIEFSREGLFLDVFCITPDAVTRCLHLNVDAENNLPIHFVLNSDEALIFSKEKASLTNFLLLLLAKTNEKFCSGEYTLMRNPADKKSSLFLE